MTDFSEPLYNKKEKALKDEVFNSETVLFFINNISDVRNNSYQSKLKKKRPTIFIGTSP